MTPPPDTEGCIGSASIPRTDAVIDRTLLDRTLDLAELGRRARRLLESTSRPGEAPRLF